MQKKKITLITSALPYANGPIHIGHLVEYIQTDIFVRFLKLTGKNAVYCCADDTHGAPIEINAQKQGTTPEKFIKRWYREHTKDFSDYNINFDSYYSTHSPENKYYTELIFNRLKKKDFIYKKDMELTYCKNCKRFLPDRYVKGKCPKCSAEDQYGDVCEKCNATYSPVDLIEPYCSVCKNPPVRKVSSHYFFKLSAFSEKLEKWLKTNKRLQPEIRNQILNWIKEGLQDWCISRDKPYFGFKIPGETDKYFYVWLDAPIGYIASTANYCRGRKCKADNIWQTNEHEIIHFIGKDIIYFHLLFWPAVLMAADFKVPDNLVVHGFLTVNGEKMSKSRGTFLTAKEFLDYVDPKFLRYYYASSLTHTMTDIDLDLKNLQEKVNNELVANIANFIYRVLSFLNKNFNGKITKIHNKHLIKDILEKCGIAKNEFENYNFREAVKIILEISSLGNKYFQDSEPWVLRKTDAEKTQAVLTDCVNIVKTLAIMLKPVIPDFSEKIEKQLNLKDLSWADLNKILENHKIGKSEIILRKIEEIKLKAPAEKAVREKDDDFSKLNLKVAEIYDVSEHLKADKLYIINIKIGKEKRQLVAGLRPYYKKEDLKGKKIVVVTNLKHADFRGKKSEGMLLAAKENNKIGLLTAPASKHGDRVFIKGIRPGNEVIDFKEFSKIRIKVKLGRVVYKDRILRTEKEEITAERVKQGIVL
ncbi:methionine--tRNA ligase [Candidatus Woesearchaeota archaeon]|nr:methionine--tRNA ligase [Candidatus Woesearchaeota archaeon]